MRPIDSRTAPAARVAFSQVGMQSIARRAHVRRRGVQTLLGQSRSGAQPDDGADV